MSNSVKIVEVGPRDGLQNEQKTLTISQKVGFVEELADCGLAFIECGSFVSPRWVPQMANSTEVFQGIKRRAGVCYSALVPNMQGLEQALACRVGEVAIFASASESFSRKNTNTSIAESLIRLGDVAMAAREAGVRVRGYVSCVLGCPYEGHVPLAAVVKVAKALREMGCYEISLGDTIGVGTAYETKALVRAVAAEVPLTSLAGHFHDTFGQALANVLAAMDYGITVFDSSVAGLGGCPYAPGASGNLATEDLVYLLEGSGMETGIDLAKLAAAGRTICATLGRRTASKVAAALEAKRVEQGME